jgi:peptidoglycan/LPS O-acetylase OafA/YrhL
MTESVEKNKYLVQLDGIRALAVLMVLFSHFGENNRIIALIPLGSMGVNIFFVLSGFLITRILLTSKQFCSENNLSPIKYIKQFYFRRILRISPIYYLTISVLYIINFAPTREVSIWLYTYLMNIKFSMPNVWESNLFGSFIHFWSLCVEEQFYLFFPLLIFFIPIQRMKLFIYFIIIIGLLGRLYLYINEAPINGIYALTASCLDSFGIGAILSFLYLYEYDKLVKILNNRMLFVALGLLFIITIVYSRNFISDYKECRTVLKRFVFSLFCFYLIGLASINKFTRLTKLFLENKKTLFIGKISYGLYIYTIILFLNLLIN